MRAIGSARSRKSWLIRRRILTRSISGIAAQPGCASRAAATALSTSLASQRVTTLTTSRECGERTSKVPALPSTQSPPISARLGTSVVTLIRSSRPVRVRPTLGSTLSGFIPIPGRVEAWASTGPSTRRRSKRRSRPASPRSSTTRASPAGRTPSTRSRCARARPTGSARTCSSSSTPRSARSTTCCATATRGRPRSAGTSSRATACATWTASTRSSRSAPSAPAPPTTWAPTPSCPSRA